MDELSTNKNELLMDSWNDDYMFIKSEPPNHAFTPFPHFKSFLMI
jgi:hypothetical protein